MNRRNFLISAAAALVVPEVVYSFPSKRFLRLNRVEIVGYVGYHLSTGIRDVRARVRQPGGHIDVCDLHVRGPDDDVNFETQQSRDLLKHAFLEHYGEFVDHGCWHLNGDVWSLSSHLGPTKLREST